MILVSSEIGSRELKPYIRQMGVVCDTTKLQFGDAAFEGQGPGGNTILIGFERKKLHDMLHCIDDARYTGHQRVGMAHMYAHSFLIIEGLWKQHESGILMEGFTRVEGGREIISWAPLRYRSSSVMYNKLYRYLISMSLGGVTVTYSRNILQTCFNIVEHFHYFQKRWEDHRSLMDMHSLALPSMTTKPPLIKRWAKELDGIGVKMSSEAEKIFRLPIVMANADEADWMKMPGVGVKTAQDIVRKIRGYK